MLRLFRREPPPAREADFIDVSHGGETYRIRVKRSAGAKRFTLRIRTAARDIVLTMPARASFKQGKSFAERHGAWIGAKLRHLPEKIGFEPGDSVPLRGVPHRIALAPRLREPGAVIAAAPAGADAMLWVRGEAAFTPRRVQDFLIREARRDLTAAVGRHAGQPWRQGPQDHAARHHEPVGILFSLGRLELFLAPYPGAALRARLSRRA